MKTRSDDMKQYANMLWKEALSQLEDVRKFMDQSRGQLDIEMHKLCAERRRLMIKLGEQTYKLAEQDTVPLPKVVKATCQQLSKVISNMTKKPKVTKSKTTTAKKSAKVATTTTAAKKSVKPVATKKKSRAK